MLILLVLCLQLAMAIFGAWVAGQKGRAGGEGFTLGLLFGCFGVLIESLLPTLARASRPAPRERRHERLPFELEYSRTPALPNWKANF